MDLQSDQKTLRELFAAHANGRFQAAMKQEADDVVVLSGNVLPVLVSIGEQFLACFVDRPVLTSTEAGEARKDLTERLESFVDAYYVEAQRLLGECSDVKEVVAGISSLSESLTQAFEKLPLQLGEQKSVGSGQRRYSCFHQA